MKKAFFKNGMRTVKDDNGLVGFENENGELVIPCQYEWARDGGFNDDGLCAVAQISENNELVMGVIDKTGKVVVPIIYDDAGFIGDEEADDGYCKKGRIVTKTIEGKILIFEKDGTEVELPKPHK